MPGLVKVLSRVAVLRVVATTDVSTGPAQPQVHPASPGREALLASMAARSIGVDEIQVTAIGCHEFLECRCEVKVSVVRARGRSGYSAVPMNLRYTTLSFYVASKRHC